MQKINNWHISLVNPNPYSPPELGHSVMCGEIEGHYKWPDGTAMHTSRIESINLDEKWIETRSGSHYELGEPSGEWIDWCAENGYTLEDFTVAITQRTMELAAKEPKN